MNLSPTHRSADRRVRKLLPSLSALCFLLSAFALAAQTNIVRFDLGSFTSTALTNRKVTLTPLDAPWSKGGKLIAADKLTCTSDSAGRFDITNMLAADYQGEILAPPASSIFYLTITNSGPNIQYAADRRIPNTTLAVKELGYTRSEVDTLLANAVNGGNKSIVSSNNNTILVVATEVSTGLTNFSLAANPAVLATDAELLDATNKLRTAYQSADTATLLTARQDMALTNAAAIDSATNSILDSLAPAYGLNPPAEFAGTTLGISSGAAGAEAVAIGGSAFAGGFSTTVGFDAQADTGVSIGYGTRANTDSIAIGNVAAAYVNSVAMGGNGAYGNIWGTAIGAQALAVNGAVAIGAYSSADGNGNVAIGGSSNNFLFASVPTGMTNTAAIIGGAISNGFFHFRGTPVIDSQGRHFGDGYRLANLNAAALSSGTVPAVRLASTNPVQSTTTAYAFVMQGTNPPAWASIITNFTMSGLTVTTNTSSSGVALTVTGQLNMGGKINMNNNELANGGGLTFSPNGVYGAWGMQYNEIYPYIARQNNLGRLATPLANVYGTGVTYSSNTLTMAQAAGQFTNGGYWLGTISNIFYAGYMSNNVATFTNLWSH